MVENAPLEKKPWPERFGLSPFGLKAGVMLYLAASILWCGGWGWAIGSDLYAMRPQTQEEITAARWQKASDPNQLTKNQPPAPPPQTMGINELFRPQPSGINPFDATRHTQATATPMTADWTLRIQTIAVLSSLPLFGLLALILFARFLRLKQAAEAEAKAAEKLRQDEERHRARRRGKGIPMRRPR
jgi:hypothetical protein